MKKKLKIIVILVVLMSFMLLNGCYTKFDFKKSENYFETDYFMCKPGIIGGLTDLGKEQEELIIPTEINEVRVRSIGYRFGNTNYWGGGQFTKLFLPEGVQINRADLLVGYKAKIIFLSIAPNFECPKNRSLGGGGGYAPALYLENYIDENYSMIRPANISFMNNYDEMVNGGYHWIDDVDEGDIIKTIPPEPERGGYTFVGWFLEEEGITEWDFDNIPFPVEDEEEQESDGIDNEEQENDLTEEDEFKQLILYAKWVENN